MLRQGSVPEDPGEAAEATAAAEAVAKAQRRQAHRAIVETQQALADERLRAEESQAETFELRRSQAALIARAEEAEAALAAARRDADELREAAVEEAARREGAEAELRARCSASARLQAELRRLATHTLDMSALPPAEELQRGRSVGGPCLAHLGDAGLALAFYPRGALAADDGQRSLYISARKGWRVKYRLFIDDSSLDGEYEWEADDLAEGARNFGPSQAACGRVGVQVLRLRPPSGPEMVFGEDASPLVAAEEASQRAARQTADDLEYALTALLRVQEAGEGVLPRALRVPPGRLDREALLGALRAAGPRLLAGEGEEAEGAVERKLRGIIGLEPVKAQIRQLQRTLRINQRKRELGAPLSQPGPLHMVFSGSPGCGKTSVARLVAELLRETGAVQGDAFVEAQRGDLVASYVGQTAAKTRAVIERAKGGVLFIDEAYRLSSGGGGQGDYGQEAIEEIMKDLTAGDPVVCLAGYPSEMDEFMRMNAGLQRRFPLVFAFPDYTPQEIARIFLEKAGGHGYRFGAGATEPAVAGLLEQHTAPAWRSRRNGAVAELLLERTSLALDARMPSSFTKEEAEVIELIDVREAAQGLMKGCKA